MSSDERSGDLDLDHFAVVLESDSGKTADLGAEIEDWLSCEVSDHVTGLGRLGYRDGTVEVTMKVEKWGNQGHCVASFTPQQAKQFIDEIADAIDCEVVADEAVKGDLP